MDANPMDTTNRYTEFRDVLRASYELLCEGHWAGIPYENKMSIAFQTYLSVMNYLSALPESIPIHWYSPIKGTENVINTVKDGCLVCRESLLVFDSKEMAAYEGLLYALIGIPAPPGWTEPKPLDILMYLHGTNARTAATVNKANKDYYDEEQSFWKGALIGGLEEIHIVPDFPTAEGRLVRVPITFHFRMSTTKILEDMKSKKVDSITIAAAAPPKPAGRKK